MYFMNIQYLLLNPISINLMEEIKNDLEPETKKKLLTTFRSLASGYFQQRRDSLAGIFVGLLWWVLGSHFPNDWHLIDKSKRVFFQHCMETGVFICIHVLSNSTLILESNTMTGEGSISIQVCDTEPWFQCKRKVTKTTAGQIWFEILFHSIQFYANYAERQIQTIGTNDSL